MDELKQFGKALRKLINSPKVFALLEEGDWGSGGCLMLAETLAKYIGPRAEILAISERREDEEGRAHDVPVSHVVVKYNDVYIDYNGAQTEEELLINLNDEGYENPEIVVFTKWMRDFAIKKFEVVCDPNVKRKLLRYLRERFG